MNRFVDGSMCRSESDLLLHMSYPGQRNARVRGTMARAAGAVGAAETEDKGGCGDAHVVKTGSGCWRSSRRSVNSIRRRGDKIIGSVPVHNKLRPQGVAAMCVCSRNPNQPVPASWFPPTTLSWDLGEQLRLCC